MKIYIGSDHAGYELKENLKKFLKEKDFRVEDKGAFELNTADDYPDFIRLVAEEIANDPKECRGIVIGGSGQGEAIICNRFKGVRAAVYYGRPCVPLPADGAEEAAGGVNAQNRIIELSREHNDANILSLGARFITEEDAKEAVELWLRTPFLAGRHQRRIDKIDNAKES